MASRKDPVARARGKKPAPVKKPFPVAMAAGSTAIALILGFFLFYAATHVGTGAKGSLANIKTKFPGIISTSGLTANHIDGKFIDYPNQTSTPPDGGNHNSNPQSCQVYADPIANEHAVHSLEHGAVWLTYDPTKLSAADIATLKKLMDGNPYRLMSPYPGLKAPISLQAWGVQIFAQSASDKHIALFAKDFTQGPQTQEQGVSCVGTTDNKVTADKTFSGEANPKGKPKLSTPSTATATPSGTQTAVPDPSTSAAATPVVTPAATPTK